LECGTPAMGEAECEDIRALVGMRLPARLTGWCRARESDLQLAKACGVSPSIQLEFHGHNDLGMATANSISAIQGGATAVSVTVNGLGERAGNAALEQVVMALRHSMENDCGIDTESFQTLCNTVAKASGRPIAVDRPITGEAICMHESGIHCRGLLFNRRSFELFEPEEVGRTAPPLVIGKHSGSAAVIHALARSRIIIDRQHARTILRQVRTSAENTKRAISAFELMRLHRKVSLKPSIGERVFFRRGLRLLPKLLPKTLPTAPQTRPFYPTNAAGKR